MEYYAAKMFHPNFRYNTMFNNCIYNGKPLKNINFFKDTKYHVLFQIKKNSLSSQMKNFLFFILSFLF